MSSSLLSCVELEPAGTATHAVIWLHGLGADGHDFEPIVPHLGLLQDAKVRFVFPHAPRIPVSVNGGMVMPAWYDIRQLDLGRGHDEIGVRRSVRQLSDIITRENERGIPCERIVLAGFSQGGAVALHTALRHPKPLAGAIGLSTYLVLADTLDTEIGAANRGLPVFLAHGALDPMVPFEAGRALRDRLSSLGYAVEWHEYSMMHEVCMDEIRDLGVWLSKRLGDYTTK